MVQGRWSSSSWSCCEKGVSGGGGGSDDGDGTATAPFPSPATATTSFTATPPSPPPLPMAPLTMPSTAPKSPLMQALSSSSRACQREWRGAFESLFKGVG